MPHRRVLLSHSLFPAPMHSLMRAAVNTYAHTNKTCIGASDRLVSVTYLFWDMVQSWFLYTYTFCIQGHYQARHRDPGALLKRFGSYQMSPVFSPEALDKRIQCFFVCGSLPIINLPEYESGWFMALLGVCNGTVQQKPTLRFLTPFHLQAVTDCFYRHHGIPGREQAIKASYVLPPAAHGLLNGQGRIFINIHITFSVFFILSLQLGVMFCLSNLVFLSVLLLFCGPARDIKLTRLQVEFVLAKVFHCRSD